MTDDKAFYTSPRHPEPTKPIPYFVSDRLDLMREGLACEQVLQLHRALKDMTYAGWIDWLVGNWAAIIQFDELTDAERNKAVSKTADDNVLLYWHACAYLECVRVRVESHYVQLRHDEHLPSPSAHDHRLMLFAAIASFERFVYYDTWMFDGENPLFVA